MKCRTQKVCKSVFLSPSANVLPTSLCPPRHNSYQIALCICQRKMVFFYIVLHTQEMGRKLMAEEMS